MKSISVCIITKNEELNIKRLLDSIKKYDFEIVLVDTGSTDKTKEIAKNYTELIFDFEWIDDFAAAKNYASGCASNDWILFMDADEWIEDFNAEDVEFFIKKYPNAVGSVWMNNITGTPECPGPIKRVHLERLYDRRKYHYVYPIHEQLMPKYGKDMENYLISITMGHSGYCMSEEEAVRKVKRNNALLMKQLEENPSNPYLLYQIGKGCSMLKEHEKACEYFGKALEEDVDETLEYVIDLVVQYGNELLETQRFKEALSYRNIYESFNRMADFVYLMGRIYLANDMYQEAADEFVKALATEDYRLEGVNSFLPAYEMTKLMILSGQNEMALKFFKICKDYPPAKELLKND